MGARSIRIAGASGSISDRRHALASFAKNYHHDPVDVVIMDFLSEANMAAAGARRAVALNPDSGSKTVPAYESAFLEALEPAVHDISRHGIKIAVNAGASDPQGLFNAVETLVANKGLNVPVAWISGDSVLETIDEGLKTGNIDLTNIYTGEKLSDWKFKPIHAQAYLGGLGIAEAFRQGAQIVVAGRVSDASPVIGAAYWWHEWNRSQLQQLANAFVAGHLIECSTYVTGGNFTGFRALQKNSGGFGWTDLGFPIAEIAHDGSVVITKQRGTQGIVTVDTCTSQLLYEIQGPWYFNSDVTAVLDELRFEQIGLDRVALHGVNAMPPPPTTKAGITAHGGYQAEALYFMTGLYTQDKARMLEAQLRHELRLYSDNFTNFTFSMIGMPQENADSQNAATVILRIFAQASTAQDLCPKRFLGVIGNQIMAAYPGATFHLDTRMGQPKPYFEYYVALLPQSEIRHTIHYQGRATLIAPPDHTHHFPLRQPSQSTPSAPVPLTSFGQVERAPLGMLVHARSGDKGSDCNCGFWVRHQDEYEWLRNLLTIEKIKQLLGKEYDETKVPRIEIDRVEMPGLKAVHFLFRNLLDRGVTSTSNVDFLGKQVAEFLRARWVDVPVKFLSRPRI